MAVRCRTATRRRSSSEKMAAPLATCNLRFLCDSPSYVRTPPINRLWTRATYPPQSSRTTRSYCGNPTRNVWAGHGHRTLSPAIIVHAFPSDYSPSGASGLKTILCISFSNQSISQQKFYSDIGFIFLKISSVALMDEPLLPRSEEIVWCFGGNDSRKKETNISRRGSRNTNT